ncbi:MAG: ATP synthase F0 subunit B [Lachnospiraceae bacterium]|nr:ATP synthase F0 subunit B [Lachnospiraceae bacterium]MBQ9607441.1 ATP synthase F0 subunit B [Lachnospiraceae bacterium]
MLSFDLVNFICMIINILILFFIAKKFLFGRVNDIIARRQAEIRDSYATADKVTKEAQTSRREYQMQVAEFEKEKSQLMDKAIKEADDRKTSIIDKANSDAEDIVKTARDEASRIRSVAEIDHDKKVEELVFDVASRLAGQAITEEANSELYDKFLAQATGKGTGNK